jgi:DNA-binding NarL/FixJ family response regulator
MGAPRGSHWIQYDLAELRYLSERFPPGEVLSHGITCDPSEVVRLKIAGKPHPEIARIMGLSSATIAAAFRRWYKKARELQASESRFSAIDGIE